MSLDTALWRRVPVRGPGRFVRAHLRWRAAHGTVITDGPCGTCIAVDPDCPSEVGVYLWRTYSPETEWALQRLADPGTTCVDVGADRGVMTTAMGVLNRGGRIIAVDLSAENCARVTRHGELNGLTVETIQSGYDQLDELLLSRAAEDVGLIRILVNGVEPRVLRGATATLRSSRPTLIFDWCPRGWARAGEHPAGPARLLSEEGYELFSPVFRPRPRWSIGPMIVEGYAAASLDDLATGTLPGAQVVALPAGSEGRARRERLLA